MATAKAEHGVRQRHDLHRSGLSVRLQRPAAEAQLLWHYGTGLDITHRMIVLTENSSPFEERGLTREMVAASSKRLRSLYGMPMLTEPPHRLPATKPACQVYVGARVHDPARADLLLRCLRRRAFSEGQPLDESDTLEAAGADAGIASDTLDAWLADEEVQTALREDMTATRSPLPEALALAHKLSRGEGGLRYSTSSTVFERQPACRRAGLSVVRGVRGRGCQRGPRTRAPPTAGHCSGGSRLGALSARHRGSGRASRRQPRSSAGRAATGGRQARRDSGRWILVERLEGRARRRGPSARP